jgi:lipopolysaccharide cholinephosphotransferase
MNDLQKKLLEMFTYLTKTLEDNGLRYYAVAGTMLGAVRHEGFIPWDDDIDIAMPRADYEKAIKLFSEVKDHYLIEGVNSKEKDFVYSFAKFYDVNTTLVEKQKIKIKRGVYIDIFPLDGIGDTYESAFKNFKRINRLNALRAIKICNYRKGRKWYKNLAAIFGYLLPLNVKKISKKIDKLCSKKDFDECNYVGCLITPYKQKEIMSKDLYGQPKKYKFENISIYGPEKYDEYLTNLYKDWRKLPPENKRVSPHNFVEIDFEKSYKQ